MTLFDVSDLESALRTAPEPEAPVARVEPETSAEQIEPGPVRPVVEVRVSSRRRKTSEARWVDGRIVVSLPAHLDEGSRQRTIDWLVQRLLTRYPPNPEMSDDALFARAIVLSDRYLNRVRPSSVRWVTNQSSRWGSCSWYSGEIRVSHRLRAVPKWVLDSVLVHELAHLTHPDHSPAFHRLANRYPRHEEAGVFLAGYELGLSRPVA